MPSKTSGWSLSRKQLFWAAVSGVAGVMAAVLAVPWWAGESGTANSADDGSQVEDNDVTAGDDVTINNYEEFADRVEERSGHREPRDLAEEYVDVEPSGDGPWPFWVVVSPDGLKVRTNGLMDGEQIGTAGDGTTVWADCQIETDFNPPSSNDVGPTWLRIRWPNDEITSEFFNSEPNNLHDGYVYLGYTVPAGHNGAIPSCGA